MRTGQTVLLTQGRRWSIWLPLLLQSYKHDDAGEGRGGEGRGGEGRGGERRGGEGRGGGRGGEGRGGEGRGARDQHVIVIVLTQASPTGSRLVGNCYTPSSTRRHWNYAKCHQKRYRPEDRTQPSLYFFAVIHILIGMFNSNPMIPQYLNNNLTWYYVIT